MTKHTFRLLAILLVAFLSFAGCSDDENTSSTDANNTNASNNPAECSLDDATCAAQGKEFNTDTCACDIVEVVVETDCKAPEDACDPNEPQSSSAYVCLDNEDGTGVCVQSCGDGGFFGTDCSDGYKCYPSEFAPAIAVDFCDVAGAGAEGANCGADTDAGDGCVAQLICVGGICEAPSCSPNTDRGPSCEGSDVCSGLSLGDQNIDIGFCQTPCVPFTDSCGAGQFCNPSLVRDASGNLGGFCIDSRGGSKAEGADCDADAECQDDLYCLGTCEPLCDPSAGGGTPGACPSGEGCSALGSADGGDLDVGNCLEMCDYDAGTPCNDPADTCVINEVAGPDFDFCTTVNTLEEGETCPEEFFFCDSSAICLGDGFGTGFDGIACVDLCRPSEGDFGATDHPDCSGNADGRFCNQAFQTTEFGICSSFECDPTLAIEDNANCDTAVDICTSTSTVNPSVGMCQETCEFSLTSDSCSGSDECSPSEFIGLFSSIAPEGDLCNSLKPATATTWPNDNFAPCTEEANGLAENQACAPFALCIDIGVGEAIGLPAGTPVCHHMCRSSEGAFDTPNHPDCPSDASSCSAVFNDPSFPGVCLPSQ